MTLDLKALKRGLDDLRAHASRGPVSSREIFTLTDPLMDMIARSETAPSGQALLEGVDARDIGEAIVNASDATDATIAIDGKVLVIAGIEGTVTINLKKLRSALLPASAEPVAGEMVRCLVDEQSGLTFGKTYKVLDRTKDTIQIEDDHGNRYFRMAWKFASPPASGAVEAGWRIERMLEIIAEAFGLVQALDKRHGSDEIARCQSNLISVLSYEDWTIPADFDELKRLLNRPAAPTEGR